MKSIFTLRNAVAALALAATTTFVAPASAQEKAKMAKEKPVAKSVAKVRALSITADLIGNTKLSGTLMDSTALEMRTSFGIATIPLSEVAGIRFASADNASTTVVMLNGDSITGATDLKLIKIETEWGTASVNGQNIQGILFVPGLSWSSHTGLNGKRWILANNKTGAMSQPSRLSKSATKPRSTKSSSPVRSTVDQSGNSILYPNNGLPTNFGR